jgi:hypothetical protein
MVILNLLCVDPVVGDMSANESDVHNLKFVFDCDDQSVAIAFDIEHHTVIAKYARGAVRSFYIKRASPASALGFGVPCPQRPFCVGVFDPK